MAHDAVELRLARLRHSSRQPGGLRRLVACGLAAATAAILPFLAGTGLLLGIAVGICPLGG
jgi:hypothetical protein